MKAHITEHPAWFHRFDVLWTPTVLIFDTGGKERYRLEGYLPNAEFRAQLEIGLARVAFTGKQWADAERRYAAVVERYPQTISAAEAVYWAGVCRYKGANNPTALAAGARKLNERYRDTLWAKKATVWLPQQSGAG